MRKHHKQYGGRAELSVEKLIFEAARLHQVPYNITSQAQFQGQEEKVLGFNEVDRGSKDKQF